MKQTLLIMLIGLFSVAARAELHSEVIEYKQGDAALEGYLSYDAAAKGKRPGVLVVHDWMGMGGYAKKRADLCAKPGYLAFALHLYGIGVRPANRKVARAEAGKYKSDRALLRARVNAGLDVLRK